MQVINIRDVAKSVAKSRSTAGGNKLKLGRGTVVVKSMRLHQGYKGLSFIAELQVIESFPTKTGVEPNLAGTTFSQVYTYNGTGDQKDEMARGNTKALLEKIVGAELSEADFEELYVEALEKQTLVGYLLKFESYEKTSTKNKVDMILAAWETVSQTQGNSDKEIAERKAKFTT